MQNKMAIYTDDAVFFCDTLTYDKPFISEKPRNHDSFAYITDGTLGYERQGKLVQIKKGQIAYIAKGAIDKSGAYGCDAVSYIAVDFNFGGGSVLSSHTLPFKIACAGTDTFRYEKLFREAVKEYSLNLPGSRMICNGILYQIIGMLYNDLAFNGIDYKITNRIKIALDYLNQNYNRTDLKISELANTTGISEKHFRRLFFDIYKKSPHEFLRDFRLNKAVLLILNTSKQISDIALQCGFSDVYSFSHCFKRVYGISPTDYRENQKKIARIP